MFKTKCEVDRHVSHILSRILEERERNSRGFQFARLYYDIAEYESAKRYLQAFLSVCENVPEAQKLMAQIWEAQKDKNKALDAWKKCLELDPEQNEVVLKVCELYNDPSVEVNSDIANYWIKRAEKHFPNNDIIFKLKERALDSNGPKNSQDLERLINEELMKSPTNVQLHIQLLRLYISSREVEQAYEHAIKTEDTLAFVSSLEWYETLLDVFQAYHDQHISIENPKFFTHKLFTMAALILLRLRSEDCDTHGTVKILQKLDRDLYLANDIHRHGMEWDGFLAEMKGQLFYLMALLLLKRALIGQISWTDASSFSAICFLLSNSLDAVDLHSSWYCQAKADTKRFYDRLYIFGCDRLSQGGHMIYSLAGKQDGKLWVKTLMQKLCTLQGKNRLYVIVFTEELIHQKDYSYFVQSDVFTGTNVTMPAKSQLQKYDSVAYSFHGGELDHLAWLAMQYYSPNDDIQPDYEQIFGCQLYPDMKYSMPHWSGGDPSTLCQLDVQVFLYATVRWAALQSREQKQNLHSIPNKPDLLPVCLSMPYCNVQQIDWWSAVNCLQKKLSGEKRPKLWGLVMRGLETIRLVVPNALSLPLVVHIAVTLDTRAKELEPLDVDGIGTPKLSAILNRAAFYWKAASEIINRMERNQSIRMPKEMIFPSDSIINPALVKSIKDQVMFAMATVAMRTENYEEALREFENLSSPAAAYSAGSIYRKLAEELLSSNQNSSGSVDYDQQIALLTKSKSALYKALDRLEVDKNEKLKQVVKRDLDDVLSKLMSLESGGAMNDSALSTSIQNYYSAESDVDSDEEPVKHASALKTLVLATPLEVRDMQRISPTRLDVQLNAIETANSALLSRISTLEESVRTSEKMMQEVFTQLRECRDDNRSLRDQIQILSLHGLSGMSISRPSEMPQPLARVNALQLGGGLMSELPFPPRMSQYGFQPNAGSPRLGSAFGQQNYDDPYGYNYGEYYNQDNTDHHNTEQNHVQNWLFGQKAGAEGNSSVAYSSQQYVRGLNPANTGMFARGPPAQYGTGYPPPVPQQPHPSQLPLHGYFAQMSQTTPSGSVQPHVGMQGQYTGATKPTASSSTLAQRLGGTATAGSMLSAPTMLPNAMLAKSHLSEAKLMLIPGSVDVPAPCSQSHTSSTPSANLSKSQVMLGTASSVLSSLAVKHQEENKASSLAQTSVQTPQRLIFQDFSLTSTLKTTEKRPEDKSKKLQQSAAPTVSDSKPFNGFSCTQVQPTAINISSMTNQVCTSSNLSSSVSFGSLAAQGQTAIAFQAGGDQKGFPGAGAVIFGNSPSPRRRNTSLCSDDHIEEYEPNVDFKPLIKLPELIEVKTGEEEEEKLFCERAKLFRFDKETQQWKERGVGELKILKHKLTQNVRILMRRDHVLKLCANHKLSAELKLTTMSSSDKAWVWTAVDFAEGEMKHEQFAARFKSQDIAEKFKSVFEQCQADMSECLQADSEQSDQKSIEHKPAEVTSVTCDLSLIFKQKLGSWNCDSCYVNNGAEILKCLCCGSLKPGVKSEDIMPISSDGFQGLSVVSGTSAGQGSGFKFGSPAIESSSGFILNLPSVNSFAFGIPKTSVQSSGCSATNITSNFVFVPQATIVGSTAGPGFRFGTPSTAGSSCSVFGGKLPEQRTTSTPKDMPSSGVGSGFKFNGTETKPKGIAVNKSKDLGEETTSQNQDLSNNNPCPIKYQNNNKESQNKLESDEKFKSSGGSLATFPAIPDTWKCSACSISNDGAEDKCHKCGKARLADTFSQSLSSIPTSLNHTPFSGNKSNFIIKVGSSDVKPLFSLGVIAAPKFVVTQPHVKPILSGNFQGKDSDKKLHASHINTSSLTTEAFIFTPASGTDKPQPVAHFGSGFNFSLSMTPLRQSVTESPSQFGSMTSPSSSISIRSPDGSDNSYYENKEGDEFNVHFKPVIELPEKVEVKTGEEDEEVLFSHHAKLYRLVEEEWKEHGIGDVKVLYHNESNKSRIVFRREHILKLFCNHYILPELDMKPLPNTKGCALVWCAMDYSDNKPNFEKFTIVFKTEENAKMFVNAIEEAKVRLKKETSESSELSSNSSEVKKVGSEAVVNNEDSENEVKQAVPDKNKVIESDSDLTIVKVEVASQEEVTMAQKLMLPDNFYLYTRKPPCPGCIGCKDDESEFQTNKNQDYHTETGDKDGDEEEEEENATDNIDNTEIVDKGNGTDGASTGFVFGENSSQFSFAMLAASANTNAFQAGEENETIEFSQRSKLFCFDKDSKQWKEKGIGDMKILKHKDTDVMFGNVQQEFAT